MTDTNTVHGEAVDLHAVAKDASERVHKNGGCTPQLAFAPILWALQDAFPPQTDVLTANDISGILEQNADADAEGLHNASQLGEKIYRAILERHNPTPQTDTDAREKVVEALEGLVSACEAEFCSPGTEGGSFTYGEDDDSEVAYPQSNITFGHIRRARQALAALKTGDA